MFDKDTQAFMHATERIVTKLVRAQSRDPDRPLKSDLLVAKWMWAATAVLGHLEDVIEEVHGPLPPHALRARPKPSEGLSRADEDNVDGALRQHREALAQQLHPKMADEGWAAIAKAILDAKEGK